MKKKTSKKIPTKNMTKKEAVMFAQKIEESKWYELIEWKDNAMRVLWGIYLLLLAILLIVTGTSIKVLFL